MAPGGLLLFVGVAMLSNRFARPLASVLGRPGQKVGGVAGGLARRNAMRNPSRTSATAAALMIGVSLVTFVAVFGAGIKSAARERDRRQDRGAATSSPRTAGAPCRPKALDAAAKVPGVTAASGVVQSMAQGRQRQDPGRRRRPGDGRQRPELHVQGAAPSTDVSKLGPRRCHGPRRVRQGPSPEGGRQVTLESPSAKHLTVTVRGIEKTKALNASSGGVVTIPVATFDQDVRRARPAPGADRRSVVGRAGAEAGAASLPGRQAPGHEGATRTAS